MLTAAQIAAIAEDLGGVAAALHDATAPERAEVYASLGLRLDYDPTARRIKATAELSRVAGRVRGGTCPLATRVTEFVVGAPTGGQTVSHHNVVR